MSGSGYARKAITIDTLNLPNNLTNTSAVVFAATGTWLSATQFALYDASSSGNLIAWWRKTDPFKLTSGQKHVVDTDTLRMVLQVPSGMYDAEKVTLGVMKQTNAAIISGNVTLFGGVIAAFTFGPTGPTGPTGSAGSAGSAGATGPTGPTPVGAVLYGSTGAIPTSDPHIVGHIWSSSGTITISAG